MKASQAQLNANKKYNEKNRPRVNYNNYKRSARSFFNLTPDSSAGSYAFTNKDLYIKELHELKTILNDKLESLS